MLRGKNLINYMLRGKKSIVKSILLKKGAKDYQSDFVLCGCVHVCLFKIVCLFVFFVCFYVTNYSYILCFQRGTDYSVIHLKDCGL